MKPTLYGYAIADNRLIIWGHQIDKFSVMSNSDRLQIGVINEDWQYSKRLHPVKAGRFITRFKPVVHYESVRALEGDFTLEEILLNVSHAVLSDLL